MGKSKRIGDVVISAVFFQVFSRYVFVEQQIVTPNCVVEESNVDVTPGRSPVLPEFVRSEIRLHALFFLMAAIILLMSFIMRTDGDQAVFLPGSSSPLPDTCSSRRLLGIDCPGCGMTRAFISISHGEFARAWHLNHASLVVYFFVAVQIPWHANQIKRLRRNQRPMEWSFVYLTPVAVVVVLSINWAWTLFRTL